MAENDACHNTATQRRMLLLEIVGRGAAKLAEDRGFEPARAVNPTRVPGERHRPLGESSAGHGSRQVWMARQSQWERVLDSRSDPARRLSCDLPQGRKAARVNGLWRVRGVPSR